MENTCNAIAVEYHYYNSTGILLNIPVEVSGIQLVKRNGLSKEFSGIPHDKG